MKRTGRLVFVSAYRLVGHNGGIISSRAVYTALREVYKGQIVLISSEEDRAVLSDLNRESFVGVSPASLPQKAVSLLSCKAFDRMSPAVDHWLVENLRADDLLFLNGALIGRFAKTAKELGVKEVVVLHQNVERDYFLDNYHPLWRSWWAGIAERNQVTGYRSASWNLFLTDEDRVKCLEQYGQGGVSFRIPAFLPRDLEGIPDLPQEARSLEEKIRVLMTGSLYTPQFSTPLKEFMKKVWPKVRAKHPETALMIAGKRPDAELVRLSHEEGIELYANPTDMEPLLSRANIYLCLVDGGSGLKFRIMDALKWGLPLLAHSRSLAGYEELVGSPWIHRYDNEADLVAELLKLVKDSPVPLEARLEIQGLFRKHHSFDVGLDWLRVHFGNRS